ncbi:MAG TPA: MFS transporter [Candidatus Deferrimicrobium sp.]|nr:MFS transporter [Candidatus Deferrimicrobium sp.]
MKLEVGTTDSSLSSFRWVVLIINWIVVFFVQASWLFILVMFNYIPFLTESQEYLIWTLPFVGLICMALPAGLIIDKYGLKRTGILGIGIVVITAFCRGLSYDFLTLALSSMFLGFGIGIVIPLGSKLIGLWFGEKEIGTATGITIMAVGLGVAISQSISVSLLLLLGTWRNIFFFYAFFDLIVLIIWLFIKEKPATFVKRDRVPFRETISKVIRNRYVWMLCGINLVLLAVYYTSLKALHPIFQINLGNEFLANLAISVISYGAMIANVIMPIMSDRMCNRRKFLGMGLIILIPALILINFLGNIGIWVLSFVIGFMVGTIAPIIMAIPVELKGVGHTYVAGAAGFVVSIGKVGGLVVPMIYLMFANHSLEIFGFIFLGILLIIATILVIFIPETAGKAREVSLEIEYLNQRLKS